jgi:GPI transamidase subunit PIG-U
MHVQPVFCAYNVEHASLCTGSACRAPPLLLPLLQPTASHSALQSVPHIAADAVSAAMLYALAMRVRSCGGTSATLPMSPATVAELLLWNPFLLLTAAAASTASLNVAAVLLALLGAAYGRAAIAAIGTAIAVYLRPQSLLLFVPISLILLRGVEDVTQQPTAAALAAAHTPADVTKKPPKCVRSGARPGHSWRSVLAFWALLAGALAVLVALSDMEVERQVQQPPRSWAAAAASCRHSCWTLQRAAHGMQQWLASGSSTNVPQAPKQAAKGWIRHVYGGLWQYDDLAVNIGLWWCASAQHLAKCIGLC